MKVDTLFGRRIAVALLLLAGVARVAIAADGVEFPSLQGRLVQLEMYDRSTGAVLSVHQKGGRYYTVGTPGHEYSMRLRNLSGGRLLTVASVDGVNVVSGETAASAQSGYVLDPWSSVEIAGWRKSLERTAAFYFTDLGDSYAARTGRPRNVGIIGVAVFEEKPPAVIAYEPPAAAPMESQSDGANRAAKPAAARAEGYSAANQAADKLGTGHGRSEQSVVTTVAFERATSAPAERLSIQYDRRENLLAMHILQEPRPTVALREVPNAFPAEPRFTPDPPLPSVSSSR